MLSREAGQYQYLGFGHARLLSLEKEVVFVVVLVCLSICFRPKLLRTLKTDCDEILCKG